MKNRLNKEEKEILGSYEDDEWVYALVMRFSPLGGQSHICVEH